MAFAFASTSFVDSIRIEKTKHSTLIFMPKKSTSRVQTLWWGTFLVSIWTSCAAFATIDLISKEDPLSPAESEEILRTGNFFDHQSDDYETPIWTQTHRKYTQHFFKDRPRSFSLKDVLHRALTDGFPIHYALEQVYRGKLNIHAQWGNIIPQINLSIGDGLPLISVHRAFSSVFSFLMPSNWIRLANQEYVYKSIKLLMMKTVLDQIYTIKSLYLTVHQLLTEYEIQSYYYTHLKLLAKKYPENSREMLTVLGQFANLGSEIAHKRSSIRLAFDTLAGAIALEKLGFNYSVSNFSIDEIPDFPQQIHELGEHPSLPKDRFSFISDMVEHSLELKAAMHFYKASRLNVGVVATGGVLSIIDKGPSNPENQARFIAGCGYGTIPNILLAKSLARTSKIDVQSGYIDLLTNARSILDQYQSAIGQHKEAKNALYINRKAFKANLAHILKTSEPPDTYFILSLSQLVQAELNLNASLHSSLKAQVGMDRYLLKDKSYSLSYLPSKGTILQEFTKLKGEKIDDLVREEEGDAAFAKVKRSKELHEILYDRQNHPIFSRFSDEEMKESVRRNIANLLFSKFGFYKSRKFFEILSAYFEENQIKLTQMEHYILTKKQSSYKNRLFHKKALFAGEYLHSLNFGNFSSRD